MDTGYEQRLEVHMRRIQRLRLFDDDFMTKCFEGSPESVALLLRVILDRSDLVVREFHVQHTLKNLQGRSVRLDIFAVDASGKVYNIEVQRENDGAGACRARFNSSLLDANVLLESNDTDTLPETYVIFITEHDVLGAGKGVYHVQRYVEETGRVFGDGSHILYVNGACRDETPVGRLMHDFACTDAAEMNYAPLAERVRYFKEDKEGIKAMCQIWEEVRNEGLQEGRKEGKKEGSKEALTASIQNIMETMQLTVEQAMDALRISPEERGYFRERV